MATCFEVTFPQPSLGLDLFPHKVVLGSKTVGCCQVTASKNTTEILPHDILVSVNGLSLFGDQDLADEESAQIHFENAVDMIVASSTPRTLRVLRLARTTFKADGLSALTLTKEERQQLQKGPSLGDTPPPPPPPGSPPPEPVPPPDEAVPKAPSGPPMAPPAPLAPPTPAPPPSRTTVDQRDSVNSVGSLSLRSRTEEEDRRLSSSSFSDMVKANRAKREQERVEEDRRAEEAKKKKEELLRLLGAKPKVPLKGASVDAAQDAADAALSAEEARRRKKEYLRMLGQYVKDDDAAT